MRSKCWQAKIKQAGVDDRLDDGEILAYASIFGNVDSYGDVVVKGAFERTLEQWKSSGDYIPLLWGHDMDDPMSNIGWVTEAKEDERGLLVRARFDLEDNPKARQVYKLCKGRRVRDLSFAFNVVDYERDGDVTQLKDLELYEVSIVTVGANPETEIIAVKNRAVAAVKAAGDLSEQRLQDLREELMEAVEAIDGYLAPSEVPGDTPDGDVPDDEKSANVERPSLEDDDPASKASANTLVPSVGLYAALRLAALKN